MGGTGLEPVTPSLSSRGGRSLQFAGVRSSSMVERNPFRERTVERTRTNTDPCHPCRAANLAPFWGSFLAGKERQVLVCEPDDLRIVRCADHARSEVARHPREQRPDEAHILFVET